MKLYYSILDPSEICRASDKDQALKALKYLITPSSELLDIHEVDENDVVSSSSPSYFNAMEPHGDVIACCDNGDLFIGNTNIPPLELSLYPKVGKEGIKAVTNDIRKGKTFFMDGCRAKSIKGSETMLYDSDMTFWFENNVLWVTFPTDNDAVKWLMYNR